MEHVYDVLVLGDYSIDLIFAGLPTFPELGRDTVGSQFAMRPGEAYNSVVAMHRLGLNVGWAADFGDDEMSQWALASARAEGLDDGLFVVHAYPYRRVSAAASFPEDRAFITYYDPAPAPPAGIRALATARARIIYLPGFQPGDLPCQGNSLLVMDGNSASEVSLDQAETREALAQADIFLPNAAEARRMTGIADLMGAIRRLNEYCRLVVLKDGRNGAWICTGAQIVHIPAIRVSPVDTTGAGDCFNAGFLKAYLDDLPLEVCVRWGCVVGGLSTLALGGTGQVIRVQDVLARLATYENAA